LPAFEGRGRSSSQPLGQSTRGKAGKNRRIRNAQERRRSKIIPLGESRIPSYKQRGKTK